MKYIDYEEKVIELIEKEGEMTRSDAQGIIMLPDNEYRIVKGHKNKTSPEIVAKKILGIEIKTEYENNMEI